jgi:hypothetical protein
MQLTRRDFLKDTMFAAAITGLPDWATALDESPPALPRFDTGTYPWHWASPSRLGQSEPIITALNRITFGPRPGDFERVQQIGIDAYIEEQLAPEKIDDSTLEAQLAQRYPTLKMSAAELWQNYPQPAPGTRPDPKTTPQQVIALNCKRQRSGARSSVNASCSRCWWTFGRITFRFSSARIKSNGSRRWTIAR